jgi:urocanate hydratase
MNAFQEEILNGIPKNLPTAVYIDPNISHAPKRKDILTIAEKKN